MLRFSSSVTLFSSKHTEGQPGFYNAVCNKKGFVEPACIWTVKSLLQVDRWNLENKTEMKIYSNSVNAVIVIQAI